MATLGKVLGGGFPMAALVAKKKSCKTFLLQAKFIKQEHFSGNQYQQRTNTVLKILTQRKSEIYPKLEKKCKELSKALVDLSINYHIDTKVYNIASMYQIFFSSDAVYDMASAKLADNQRFQVYFHELLKNGVFVPPGQFETCFISTAHIDEDLKNTIEAFDKALHAASKVKGTR